MYFLKHPIIPCVELDFCTINSIVVYQHAWCMYWLQSHSGICCCLFFAGYFLWLKTFFGTCFAHWPQNANQWVRAIFKRIWSHWSRSTQCFGPKHSSLNRQSQSYWFGHVWDLLRCLMILMCGTHTTTMPKRKFGATSRFPRCLFLFPTYLTETSIQNQHLNLIHILLFR